MQGSERTKIVSGLVVLALAGGLGACNTTPSPLVTGSIPDRKPALVVSDEERDCLGRAMYFESNRSDQGGLLAVGTVVMNRLEAAIFPGGICAVVGQPGQFAPGVLTKPMQERDLQKVADAADAVLAGERHPKVGKAMYFHTAGHHFPYKNMHYVAVAGGNAFYEKRDSRAARKEMPNSPALPTTVSTYAAIPALPAAQ
ncbi:cell wall hydrolase [Methylobacterium pseudosasicola]|uniref:Cell Wall Hydrolase n=1 Tax=Methylobacterium pseudosasicola TaxID=582667 RepID=A0A1I4RQ81_9HYPH|nr:cell wall hydrolase [Methylobacterium pseudosasicola]SFM54153.1 Cell Wall Hydrolase [Methylobacterium pseudosasicola]